MKMLFSVLSAILTIMPRERYENSFVRRALFTPLELQFDNPDMPSWVQLDGFKSNPDLGIVRGRLKISG